MVRAVRTVRPSLWWLVRPRHGPRAIEYAWAVALAAFLAATMATGGSELTLLMHGIADYLVGIPAPPR
jgi:hypothetical protein